MTPEEKLLRAIFGEKASDVRDTSLRLPPGVAGTVVEVRVFNRHGIDIDDRTRAIQTEEKERLKKDADDEKRHPQPRHLRPPEGNAASSQVATAAPKSIKKGATHRRRHARGDRAATTGGRSPSRTTSARPISKR